MKNVLNTWKIKLAVVNNLGMTVIEDKSSNWKKKCFQIDKNAMNLLKIWIFWKISL